MAMGDFDAYVQDMQEKEELAKANFCEPSQHIDGKIHSWKFDGDDPYIICHWCGQVRDALRGRIVQEGKRTKG